MERELHVVEGGYYSRLEEASDAAPAGVSVNDRRRYKERFLDVAEVSWLLRCLALLTLLCIRIPHARCPQTMKMMFDECLG